MWQLYLGYVMFYLLKNKLNPSASWYDFREEVQVGLPAGSALSLFVIRV